MHTTIENGVMMRCCRLFLTTTVALIAIISNISVQAYASLSAPFDTLRGFVASGVYAIPDRNLLGTFYNRQLINLPPLDIEDRGLAGISSTSPQNNIPLSTPLPTVMYFYSKDCTSCKILDKDLNQIKKQYGRKVRILYIDCNDRTQTFLVQKYQIILVPSFVYLDSHNTFLVKAVGYSGIDEITKDFRRLLYFEKIYTRALSARKIEGH